MNEHKLKIVLTLLVGVIFSFIFIILAFAVPTTSNEVTIIKKPSNILEEVSKSMRN